MIRQTIILATLCSVLAHFAGFSAAYLMLGERFDVQISAPLLLVSVDTDNSDSEFINGTALPTPAPTDPLNATAAKTIVPESSTRATISDVSAEPRIDLVSRRDADAAVEAQTAQSNQSLLTFSVAEFKARKIAQPAADTSAETEKLSAKQENMLERKISKWARQLTQVASENASRRWRYKGKHYQARFTKMPPADHTGLHRVLVDISTDDNGERRSTQMSLKKLAFSNYAQLVDHWDPTVELHNDELEGRFHSNSEIHIAYSRDVMPVFYDSVTTAAQRIRVKNSVGFIRRSDIFRGGLKTGVKSIRLPGSFRPQLESLNIDEQQLIRFSEHSHLTFLENGSMELRTEHDDTNVQIVELPDNMAYLIADSKVRLCVQGKVHGKILVYSPERIIISNDLVYADASKNTTDFLGLVSDKVIEVAGIEKTGKGDLHVHGALYAKRRFAVRNHSDHNNGILSVFGSLSAGSLTATEPRYRTRVRFDQRLHEQRPPGFPLTDHFEIEQWNKTWHLEAI
ncbi:MAG: hypothetical protein AB8B48_14865 [Pseudomonadales bacterium]